MAHFMEILQAMSDDFNSVVENSSQIQFFNSSYWLNNITYKEYIRILFQRCKI